MINRFFQTVFILGCTILCNAQNRIQNGSFELLDANGLFPHWSYSPEVSNISQDAFRGKYSAGIKLIRPEGIEKYGQAFTQRIYPLDPGEYQLLIHGKVSGDGSAWASWSFYDAENRRLDVPLYWSGVIKASAEWQRIEQLVTIPAGTAHMNLNILYELSSPDFAGTGWFDAVSLTPVNTNNIERPKTAKLVYNEIFTAESLAENWKIFGGKWHVDNHTFYGCGPDAKLFFKHDLASPNLRLEFTAWSPRPGDLSVWMNGTVSNTGSCNGYFFGSSGILVGGNFEKGCCL